MTQDNRHLTRSEAKCALFIASLIGAALLPQQGTAEALTFADLDGATIDARIVAEQTARSSKGVTNHRVTSVFLLKFENNKTIKSNLAINTTMLDGTTRTRNWKAEAEVGKPYAWRDGQAVWILEGNTLVQLRTLAEGGNKLTIAFEGNGSNLSCKISRDLAPEVGVGKMTSGSTASGHKIQILKQKDVSASCRVIKK